MITRNEISTAAALGSAWVANIWEGYAEPLLQAAIILLTVLGAAFMVWLRFLDIQLKRKQLREKG
ncbi:hypothetical protein SAMN04488518_11335 [Pseudovibrio ascidiaceicola]|uniref:Holin n=1 Tax=Pseudovibrio ascidiaceicola TaxID=285279 RepID=A0A1I4E0X3_9HYPH|nr:hypothetical protein [Pseudovibrio ascidiaceicola]SFK98016.1 hypothetical protein SAMN04488518_11335 [Pseudovibrio ascidiaceicola]